MSDNPDETAYYLRLLSMFMDLGTEAVLEVFVFHSPGRNAEAFLKSKEGTLTKMMKDRILNRQECDLLFEKDKTRDIYKLKGIVDLKRFDISLIITLSINLFDENQLTPPKKGWENPPRNSDKSIAADLLRLRTTRNVIVGHYPKAQLAKWCFDEKWEEVSKIILRIRQQLQPGNETVWEKRINSYRLQTLDPTVKNMYDGKLREWHEDVSEVQDQVEDLLKKLEGFDAYFNNKCDRYERYIKLLVQGGGFVMAAFIKEQTKRQGRDLREMLDENEDTIKAKIADVNDLAVLYPSESSSDVQTLNTLSSLNVSALEIVILQALGKAIEDDMEWAVRTIGNAYRNYAETALVALDSNTFEDFSSDLKASLRIVSKNLNKDQAKEYYKILEECKRKITENEFKTYVDELRTQGKHIRTFTDICKETLKKTKEFLQDMVTRGISFKYSHEIDLKMITLGTSEEKKQLAENILTDIWLEAVNRSVQNSVQNPEFADVKKEVENILDEIRKSKSVTNITVTQSCIIVKIACTSPSDMLDMINYFESSEFHESLNIISKELGYHFNTAFAIKAFIPVDSLWGILNHQGVRKEGIHVHISVSSPAGMLKLRSLFNSEEIASSTNSIADALSKHSNDTITLKVETDMKAFTNIFDEDSSSDSSTSGSSHPVHSNEPEEYVKEQNHTSSAEIQPEDIADIEIKKEYPKMGIFSKESVIKQSKPETKVGEVDSTSFVDEHYATVEADPEVQSDAKIDRIEKSISADKSDVSDASEVLTFESKKQAKQESSDVTAEEKLDFKHTKRVPMPSDDEIDVSDESDIRYCRSLGSPEILEHRKADLKDAEPVCYNPDEFVYYLRLLSMYMDLGTNTALDVFVYHSPGKDPHAFLKSKEETLIKLKRNGILNKREIKLLLVEDERTGKCRLKYAINLQDFDISILITLSINLFTKEQLPPPKKGWDNPPRNSDKSLAADLLRLRTIRNVIAAHCPSARMSRDRFDEEWQMVSEILLRIQQQINQGNEAFIKMKIESYRLQIVDPSFENMYNEKLRYWHEDVSKMQDKVEDLLRKLDGFDAYFKTKCDWYEQFTKLLVKGGKFLLSSLLNKQIKRRGSDLRSLLDENKDRVMRSITDPNHLGVLYPSETSSQSGPLDMSTLNVSILAAVILQLFDKDIGRATKRAVTKIGNAYSNYAENALIALDSNTFEDFFTDLKTSLEIVSENLSEDQANQYYQILAECKRKIGQHEFQTYMDELNAQGTQMKTFKDIFKDTLQKTKDCLKDMMKKGISFKKSNELELKMITLGIGEEKEQLAENILIEIWHEALSRSVQNPEFADVKKEVENILGEIRKSKSVTNITVFQACIILQISCTSPTDVLHMINYFESSEFHESLHIISKELGYHFNTGFAIHAFIPVDTLWSILNPQSSDSSSTSTAFESSHVIPSNEVDEYFEEQSLTGNAGKQPEFKTDLENQKERLERGNALKDSVIPELDTKAGGFDSTSFLDDFEVAADQEIHFDANIDRIYKSIPSSESDVTDASELYIYRRKKQDLQRRLVKLYQKSFSKVPALPLQL